MQAISPVTYEDFNLAGQELLYRFEIYDGAAWVNLCSLGGLNYLVDKTLSMNLGGAGVSPDPIAGTWSATIQNDDGIFHPRHPTSAYSSLLRVGRKVRISVGAKYGGTDYFWQRMIGYMDAPKFNNTKRQVSLSGMDYMKPLADTALRSPSNYWGASVTLSSVETTKTFGAEKYLEDDALLCQPPGDDLDVNPVGWSPLHGVFISENETGGGSDFVGHLETSGDFDWTNATKSVGSIVNGKVYEVAFKYKKQTPSPYDAGALLTFSLHNSSTNEIVVQADGLAATTWTAVKFHFTAPYSCNTYLKLLISPTLIDTPPYITVYWIDQLTFREVTARTNTRYVMPAACNGVYYVTLDGTPLWYGDNNAGWLYDEANKTFYFDDNIWVETGTSNLVIYYFTTQDIVNVLADVLAEGPGDAGGGAGLYANRAAALAALSYTDPAIMVPKVWFEPGPALDAVRRICERSNYRFWMDEAGVPHFQPAPTHGDPVAWFSTRTVAEYGDFQDVEEVRNRIVIEGIEQGAFSTAKDKKTSRLVCAATSDAASIAAYREKTHSITNDLFQDQASLDAMATTLLAFYKEPKLYTDLPAPHNPIPIERGDTVEWDIELRVPDGGGTDTGLKNTVRGIVRNVSFSGDGFTYKCEMRSAVMNIANYATGPVVITAEHCKGWMITNSGAGADIHFDLPAAVVGMEITFYVMAAYAIQVDPNGTDQIMVLTGAAGDYLASDAVVGSYIVLGCLAANKWHKLDIGGTWTEE